MIRTTHAGSVPRTQKPGNLAHSAVRSVTGTASPFHIVATHDPAGSIWGE